MTHYNRRRDQPTRVAFVGEDPDEPELNHPYDPRISEPEDDSDMDVNDNRDKLMYQPVNVNIDRDEECRLAAEEKRKEGCCHKFSDCITRVFKPCLAEYHPLPPNATCCDRFRYFLMCPPHGIIASLLCFVLIMAILWGFAWAITHDAVMPGGQYFGLFVLFPLAVFAGIATEMIRLPPLLGMLLVGVMLRNVPVINVAKDIDPGWSAAIRSIALVVILIRAGLGLDPKALKKLSFVVLRLAFLPCLFEAATVAVAGHLLLGFPWVWGFILGFIHSAVSPAVVVPSMLRLQEQHLGTDKGIPTMVIAAGTIDDVIAISGFGIAVGIAFSEGSLAFNIARGPLEAVGGILFGLIMGGICWYLPTRKNDRLIFYRFIVLFSGGLFAVFGSKAAELPGAGALGCLTMAFVAAMGWRNHGWQGTNPVTVVMGRLWEIFQPLLFGLIGAAVDISKVTAESVGLGIAVLFIGLTIRIIVSFLVMFRTPLNLKERCFVPFAWLPKATVQAALGSVALDTALDLGAPPDVVEMGRMVLAMAVLIILITAPIGALAIALTAPRLLSRQEPELSLKEGGKDKREVAKFEMRKREHDDDDDNA